MNKRRFKYINIQLTFIIFYKFSNTIKYDKQINNNRIMITKVNFDLFNRRSVQ